MSFAGALLAAVTLGSPFTDGVILQRNRPVPIWGWADAGEKVKVSFAGQTVSAIADHQGRWRITLAPLAASKEGGVLTANECTVKDVLVGEVWFCSGQSNMQYPLVGYQPHLTDRLGPTVAQTLHYSAIRFVHTPMGFAGTPQERSAAPVHWQTFEPENFNANFSFSAIGTYYALEIYHALDGAVPVGIVGVYEGGTGIDAWTPRESETKEPKNALAPGVLFNQMVNPWCPYALRGVIWYQGCFDARWHDRYTGQMHALYDGWAKRFGQKDMPFYFVQLAPWWESEVPQMQEAQARFAREQPNAAIAIINDIGNGSDIHPQEKQTVAKRLALHALKRLYGFKDIEDESPVLKSWRLEGDAFHLTFDHAKKLHLYNADFSPKSGFEIAGADGRFVEAEIANLVVRTNFWKKPEYQGSLRGAGLVVRAKGVSAPRKLRYLHRQPWRGNVYNEVNLPLGAFHVNVADTIVDVGSAGAETPAKALAHVRAARQSGQIPADNRVILRLKPEVYRLSETLRIGPEDSNILFSGTMGKTVLSGAQTISGFTVDAAGVWHAKVPAQTRFEQLWVNGRLAVRAREPNAGRYFYIREPIAEAPDPDRPGSYLDLSSRSLVGFPQDVAKLSKLSREELERVVAIAYYGWDTDWMHITHVDPTTGLLILRQSHARDFFMWPKHLTRYSLENFRAALDAPGEWFLDEAVGELLYLPRPDERPETALVEAPRLERVVDVKGDSQRGYVTDIAFDGLTFAHAGWKTPPSIFTRQAAYNVDAGFELSGVRRFRFTRCTWEQTAAHGVWAKEDCREGSFRYCRFDRIGAGAVWIGSRQKAAPEAETRDIAVEDCIITRTGLRFPEGTGVAVAFASRCRLCHNELADIGYTGISIGYSWNYRPQPNRDTLVANNHIHHLGRATESDMAGVYTLGDNYGTKIVGNYIHDIVSYDYTGFGGEGLYTDEGSSGTFWASNVVCRTRGGSINMNFGRANVFCDNVLVSPGRDGLEKEPFFKHWQQEGHVTAIVSNNQFYADDVATAKTLRQGYDKPVGTNIVHGGNTLAPQTAFATNAYAKAIIARAGVRGDSAWRAEAAQWAFLENPPLPAEPPRYGGVKRLATGFESLRVGDPMPQLFGFSCGGAECVRVTDRVVRNGKRAIEVFDRRDLGVAVAPEFHYRVGPPAKKGTFVISFSIRLMPDACVKCEVRDNFPTRMSRSSYVEGLLLVFEKGWVVAGGKRICAYRPDAWYDCAVTVELGDGHVKPVIDILVKTADGAKAGDVKAVPLAHPAFGKVSWIGFFSNGDNDTRWYLDDFACERQ